ncbi:MAG: hypothetical protein LKI28_05805 [Ancrocorticia sp.]|nr:hypothetical protein [Ancrocorticia sp.]
MIVLSAEFSGTELVVADLIIVAPWERQLDVDVCGSGKAAQEEPSEFDHAVVRIAMSGIGDVKNASVGDRFTARFIDPKAEYPRIGVPDLGFDLGLSTA